MYLKPLCQVDKLDSQWQDALIGVVPSLILAFPVNRHSFANEDTHRARPKTCNYKDKRLSLLQWPLSRRIQWAPRGLFTIDGNPAPSNKRALNLLFIIPSTVLFHALHSLPTA